MSSYKTHRILRGRNGILFFLAALCVYFSYFSLFGERSFSRLQTLENQIYKVEQELASYQGDVKELNARVQALRPGAVDKDLLEERVRYMLGYRAADEWDVL